MFTEQDAEFDEITADPIRRRANIADLSKRRTVISWCAVVISISAIAESWSGKGVGGVFAAAVA